MLGERLQYLRLEKGMTQKELSKVFKVSLKTIQFYEQNRTIPDIYLVAEMAKFFNVSCDYILGVVNTPIPLDEREAEAKDHIYMPKEFMKNKETRRTYKTIVEYVKNGSWDEIMYKVAILDDEKNFLEKVRWVYFF